MKPILTLLIILLCLTATYAQEHILGIKAGPVKNFNGNEPDKHGIYQTLEKGVYYRHNTKGRLSLEIGLAYHNYTEQTGPLVVYDGGFYIYDSKYVVDIIDVQASLQYNITPNSFRNSAILKNINNYLGFVLGHRSSKETTKWYTIDDLTQEKGEGGYSFGGIECLAGLNYTISYTVNRMIIQSTSTILAGTGDFGEHFPHESDFPSARLSINLGIGYNLFKNKK